MFEDMLPETQKSNGYSITCPTRMEPDIVILSTLFICQSLILKSPYRTPQQSLEFQKLHL